jgi:hypothetical protein
MIAYARIRSYGYIAVYLGTGGGGSVTNSVYVRVRAHIHMPSYFRIVC